MAKITNGLDEMLKLVEAAQAPLARSECTAPSRSRPRQRRVCEGQTPRTTRRIVPTHHSLKNLRPQVLTIAPATSSLPSEPIAPHQSQKATAAWARTPSARTQDDRRSRIKNESDTPSRIHRSSIKINSTRWSTRWCSGQTGPLNEPLSRHTAVAAANHLSKSASTRRTGHRLTFRRAAMPGPCTAQR